MATRRRCVWKGAQHRKKEKTTAAVSEKVKVKGECESEIENESKG